MISSVHNLIKVPVLLKGNTVNSALNATGENKPVLALIDTYRYPLFDVNGDYKADCTHGDFNEALAKSLLPEVQIRSYKLRTIPYSNNIDPDSVIEMFNEIYKDIQEGKRIDVVNFPFSEPIKFSILARKINKPVTKDNIHKHKANIIDWLKKCSRDENLDNIGLKKMHEELLAIEKVTKLGIPVYTGAGNLGPDSFNLVSLAEGTRPVAALENDDEGSSKLHISGDNSMVKESKRGVFYTSHVFDNNGVFLGYSLTDNNDVVFKTEFLK